MNKRWTILEKNKKAVEILQPLLKVNETICTILTQRGYHTFESTKSFFRPQLTDLHDPFLMKDMHKAVKRIQAAFTKQEKILVFGDYDVDGTTSVALMYQFLSSIYSNELLAYYIPHRYKEGYGISKLGIDYAAENNFTLIISLDCGIKSIDLIGYAKTLGIDFIVCDHHLPDTLLPPAVAILNAKQLDCTYPYKELCGCGVGFKLITALAMVLKIAEAKYTCYLDLVATAIAADIVPITGENRVLAYFGMQQINTQPCAGIKALITLGGLQGKLSINNVVFVIAPRVNAAGRMDDAKKAVQLFIEKDTTNAIAIAALLHNDNSDRKEADSSITEEAISIIENDPLLIAKKTTVVYKEDWHKGVVGIVASRLIEKFYRPTVVLTKSGDVVAGSARSVVGFNLYEAIYACRQHLLGYGGHFAAAGMTMLPEQIAAFAESFEKEVAATITDNLLIPEIIIDAEISFKDITTSLFSIITQMEPFGPENMRPVFITKAVVDTGFSKVVKEQHIRFVVMHSGKTISGIGFNLAPKFNLLAHKNPIDIVYTIDENTWNEQTNLQLKVIDLRSSN
jgi:single-stranded-DNA-specific exonuclease